MSVSVKVHTLQGKVVLLGKDVKAFPTQMSKSLFTKNQYRVTLKKITFTPS